MKRLFLFIVTFTNLASTSIAEEYDPCCSFPCLNRGVCISTKNYESYTCDCTGLSYYGKNCETPTIGQRLFEMVNPGTETTTYIMSNFPYLWYIVEKIEFLPKLLFKNVFLQKLHDFDLPALYIDDGHDYTTLDSATNTGVFVRMLPPVPKHCPTELGVKGKQHLPSVDEVVKKLFRRNNFVPNSLGLNLMFTFVSQFITHHASHPKFQARTDSAWGSHIVDGTQIYGKHVAEENMLRSKVDGKMKMQVINGEEYPPYLKETSKDMFYPDELQIPEESKFALGQRFFGILPGLFLMNTIFLREHNRVCNILKAEYPLWDDERLFQTSKLIMIGVAGKILTSEYFSSISNFNLPIPFLPTTFHQTSVTYDNRLQVEMINTWHQLLPDEFHIDGLTYSTEDYLFHSELVIKHGTRNFTAALTNQIAGELTLQNNGKATLKIISEAMQHLRNIRTQSYNEYRKRFHLAPKKSIDEITDNEEHRRILKELYGDVDGVEYYVGVVAEKRMDKAIMSVFMNDLMLPGAIQSYFANPIFSHHYWKPSTFGGQVGFNIVQTASLQKLFCENIPGECPPVFFRAPGYFPENNIANGDT